MVHNEKQVNVNLNLTSIKQTFGVQTRINKSIKKQKQIMHESNNYVRFKLKDIATGSVKMDKNNFINIITDNLALSIR